MSTHETVKRPMLINKVQRRILSSRSWNPLYGNMLYFTICGTLSAVKFMKLEQGGMSLLKCNTLQDVKRNVLVNFTTTTNADTVSNRMRQWNTYQLAQYWQKGNT
jgi:hypothetical protein